MGAALPHGTGQAEMWGWAMGGAPLLLLLLLLPGAVGLQCLSCGAEDGTCRGATNVTCPPESDVCAEALASVTWSHGRLALGGRGCGRGQPGAIARAIELAGVVVFVRRRQCRAGGGGACNGLLPLGTDQALPVPDNVTAPAPNGLRCFGCPDDGPCSAPTVVECYGDLRGCFHGNVSVTLGGVQQWRELRGCVRDTTCAREPRGDDVVGLQGSCCAGDLCNGPAGNRSLFAPDLPRLELLPQPHGPTAGPTGPTKGNRSAGGATTKMAASTGKMAAPIGNVSATKTNMAAAISNVSATKTNMAATIGNVSATKTNMAAAIGNVSATKTNMAAPIGDVATTKANMAAPVGDVATTKANMAASTANMAATIANMAAGTTGLNGSLHGVHGNAAAMDSKMAAGRAGRPLERKDGVKGPVGRSHPLGGGLWPFPFLLLLLL